MRTGKNILEILPRESILTYAVLFGKQVRRHDPYAVGAQIIDLAVKGDLSIQESAHDKQNLILQIHAGDKSLEEEELFVNLLCGRIPKNSNGVALHALTNSKEFMGNLQILWKRVVMMHHTNYNKNRPLYNTDPTQSVRWQLVIRILGYLLAIVSVYAEPGWQGVVAGFAVILTAHEVPALLTTTVAGRVLSNSVVSARTLMLRLVDSNKPDKTAIAAYEQLLPFAFLFDDELKQKWPIFLSQHYDHYPSWLVPAQPVADRRRRQEHIAAMLQVMGTLHFPARKQAAIPG